MTPHKKIRVLIVDDSIFFREAFSNGLSKDFGIEVVGTAEDAFQAKDKIVALQPDVMTLDVEMPKMNGIEFLQRLLPQYPIPVVVVSSVKEHIFDALKAGAVDFVLKSDIIDQQNAKWRFNELIVKVKIASIAKVGSLQQETVENHRQLPYRIPATSPDLVNPIIGIGASTGGTEAIAYILKQFPPNTPGTLIVQHMPPVFTKLFADRLNDSCPMEVKEAQNGDKILPGRVLIAPGDQHMWIKKVKEGLIVECQPGEKVNGHCPSVGVLFDSIAKNAGKNAIGIILTGMGGDGADGLLHMRESGATTIGQDEESSVVYGMPNVAFEIGAVEEQASLKNIPLLVMKKLNQNVSNRF